MKPIRVAGWGAEVVSEVVDGAFKYLDAAPIHLGAKACPLPFNIELENAVVPSVQQIVEAAKKVCYR